jgi:hypothetical protein
MSENVLGGRRETSTAAGERVGKFVGRPTAFGTIVLGGLVVALLDGIFAITYYGLILGVPKLRIFQTVAAGLIGTSRAYAGGSKTFLLGIGLHIVVATCIATVFYFASLKLPIVIQHPVVSGLIYGVIAYLGMKFIVTPLSAIGRRPVPRLSILMVEILGHAFLVGLPIAVLARRSARN